MFMGLEVGSKGSGSQGGGVPGCRRPSPHYVSCLSLSLFSQGHILGDQAHRLMASPNLSTPSPLRSRGRLPRVQSGGDTARSRVHAGAHLAFASPGPSVLADHVAVRGHAFTWCDSSRTCSRLPARVAGILDKHVCLLDQCLS